MNNWHSNSWKPRQHKPCELRLTTGEITEGVYVKDINKYITGVNRWRLSSGKWIDDEQVVQWREK